MIYNATEHPKCPACKSALLIGNSKTVAEGDPIEIFSELQMMCNNPKCDNYHGGILNNPDKVVETVRNKIG